MLQGLGYGLGLSLVGHGFELQIFLDFHMTETAGVDRQGMISQPFIVFKIEFLEFKFMAAKQIVGIKNVDRCLGIDQEYSRRPAWAREL